MLPRAPLAYDGASIQSLRRRTMFATITHRFNTFLLVLIALMAASIIAT